MFRTIATSLALLVLLAVVGAVAGPQWDPVPVRDHITPARSDTTVHGVDPGSVGQVGDHEVLTTEITVPLGDESVQGLLRQPLGSGGEVLHGRPGVVFVHGAGTGSAHAAFTDTAHELASTGIVTLVPDKRLDNYSTRERDYVEMAADYQHSVDLLRGIEGVDPLQVGLYGESEGAWIVPVMQALDPRIPFTIQVSAPVVPPRQQAAYAVDNYLRNTGVPEQVFRAIPRAVGMQLPGGGFDYADFDVTPWLQQQTAPLLMVYGTNDPSMPLEQGVRQVLADTAVGVGDAPVTVRFYADANHGIKIAPPGGAEDYEQLVLHPHFVRDVAAWVQGLPDTATAPPRIAGAQPEQLFLASPVPRPGWWGDGDMIVMTVVVGVALSFLPLLGWLVVSSIRRGRGWTPLFARGVGPALAGMGLGAVATTVVLGVYLVAVARLALDYQRDDLVVQGGWIGVRLLGVAAAVAAAVLLQRVVDVMSARRTGAEVILARGRVAKIILWCVVVGSASLLVTLAYWGVYQLGL